MSDSVTNYNYVGDTKVSVSIKMHIKWDISIWNIKIILSVLIVGNPDLQFACCV